MNKQDRVAFYEMRTAEAKARCIEDAARRLGIQGLRRAGSGELVGPCPVCGGAHKRGSDRFSINKQRGLFNCRKCGQGGDVIGLVQHIQGCEFGAAIDFLIGREPFKPLSPAEIERRQKEAARIEAHREAVAQEARKRAIADARAIWDAAEGVDVTPAREYLAGRGVVFPVWPFTLRVLPTHRYMAKVGNVYREIHKGPAMIAAVQNAEGRLAAVHQTWLDPNGPKGKARIILGDEEKPAKLTRGSVKGGAIRLSPRPADGGSADLFMGEGIETTGAALMAGPPGAVYWAGVSLGNMAGKKMPRPHPPGWPDMSDDRAWLPPPWASGLYLIKDGDSDPVRTDQALMCCARRARAVRDDLPVWMLDPGAGVDLSDVLNSQKNKDQSEVAENDD